MPEKFKGKTAEKAGVVVEEEVLLSCIDVSDSFMQQEKTHGHPISIIRQDNAGENKKLVMLAHSKEWKLETNFENTARKTPQQNSYAEQAFTVIAAKMRAVMNAAQIPKSEHFKTWSEAATTVTALDNLIPVAFNGETKT